MKTFLSPPGMERLYIADFFLANPPLLHRTSMTSEMRKSFSSLRVQRPEKSFIFYPSSQLLFHKMESIQKAAMNALLGKGIISVLDYKMGRVALTEDGEKLFPLDVMSTEKEALLSEFLANEFAAGEEPSNLELRRRAGLRRPV